MSDDRMFAQLMETQPEEPAASPKSSPPARPRPKTPELNEEFKLPDDFEEIGEAGYTSHSYRLTDAEVRWLRRFCFKLSQQLDRTISQNEVIRSLFRIADRDSRARPEDNQLLDELTSHKV